MLVHDALDTRWTRTILYIHLADRRCVFEIWSQIFCNVVVGTRCSVSQRRLDRSRPGGSCGSVGIGSVAITLTMLELFHPADSKAPP